MEINIIVVGDPCVLLFFLISVIVVSLYTYLNHFFYVYVRIVWYTSVNVSRGRLVSYSLLTGYKKIFCSFTNTISTTKRG